MDINTEIATIPLHLQQDFKETQSVAAIADATARGIPAQADLTSPTSSAVLQISEEAISLASVREDEASEEVRHGDRSILGGVDTQGTSPVSEALDRVNQPLDGSSLVPETIFERPVEDLINEANQDNQALALAQKTRVVANEDMTDLHMAMQAAAFQIPPEVNGTQVPIQSGKIAEQDDPTLTPVDPALASSEGPLASSVMGMEPLSSMHNEFKSAAKSLVELQDQRQIFDYGAAGDAGKSVSEMIPQVVEEMV